MQLLNKNFVAEVIDIQNPNILYPILCIHCNQDEMEIVKNTTLPNDIINLNIPKENIIMF